MSVPILYRVGGSQKPIKERETVRIVTDKQLERRYNILLKLVDDERANYTINLNDTSIYIRNNTTLDGIFTDSLQTAKKWIRKDRNISK